MKKTCWLLTLLLLAACMPRITPEHEQMEQVWQTAQEHYRNHISMIDDTLLPRAVRFYRERPDSARLLEGYMLEAAYERWNGRMGRATEVLDEGLACADALKDSHW
ncbi:MAG: hypothetical protein IJ511_03380 [Bacteroides sp.]|nr:hypothetical protein [Bacteroides sp.]